MEAAPFEAKKAPPEHKLNGGAEVQGRPKGERAVWFFLRSKDEFPMTGAAAFHDKLLTLWAWSDVK
ncbi:hypothetical protein [Sphingobium chungbukense]|uniref:Uncharacterized protein n=1 Tax=Sphingobium chungbukense TaxID=56193 RepID=A0A0M3ARZ2_9SPHN|nr:hypothetical protein [Sphingobium chungbukense]KKW91284.1 hypothetical protein YP76_17120 [Sphingobium chungbukense]